jgi:hypothetical protein
MISPRKNTERIWIHVCRECMSRMYVENVCRECYENYNFHKTILILIFLNIIEIIDDIIDKQQDFVSKL